MAAKVPLTKWAFRVGKLVALLGALAATYGLFALASFQLALKSREVSVPSLRGLTPEEAEGVLAELELTLRIDPVRRVTDTVTLGRVAEQDPSSGLTTRSQRSVKTWLSSGPTPASIPALIGASESAARRSLEENGFSLHELSEIRSNQYQIDAVVAQAKAPDGNAQRISLLVNRGERGMTFVMPNLIGVNSAAAADVLRSRGFRIAVVADHPYPGIPPGIILRQSPEAGFQIAPGESISVEVSQ